MNWIFSNLGFVAFVFVAVSVVRAILKAAQLSAEHKVETNETDEQKHLREIQERIRRKIAERRGGVAPLAPGGAKPMARPPGPPMLPPMRMPPLDPFGGPMRRLAAELERRIQPTQPPTLPMQTAAVLERQNELAEQMRALEASRLLAERRAAEIAAMRKAAVESGAGALTAAQRDLLADLRDPRSLRRAFLLREVLGAPVGLR